MSLNRVTINIIAFTGMLFLFPYPALAGQAEAREAARMNNCTPKKIEVFQNALGSFGKTVYKVSCNLPKMAGTANTATADAVLIAVSYTHLTLPTKRIV